MKEKLLEAIQSLFTLDGFAVFLLIICVGKLSQIQSHLLALRNADRKTALSSTDPEQSKAAHVDDRQAKQSAPQQEASNPRQQQSTSADSPRVAVASDLRYMPK